MLIFHRYMSSFHWTRVPNRNQKLGKYRTKYRKVETKLQTAKAGEIRCPYAAFDALRNYLKMRVVWRNLGSAEEPPHRFHPFHPSFFWALGHGAMGGGMPMNQLQRSQTSHCSIWRKATRRMAHESLMEVDRNLGATSVIYVGLQMNWTAVISVFMCVPFI